MSTTCSFQLLHNPAPPPPHVHANKTPSSYEVCRGIFFSSPGYLAIHNLANKSAWNIFCSGKTSRNLHLFIYFRLSKLPLPPPAPAFSQTRLAENRKALQFKTSAPTLPIFKSCAWKCGTTARRKHKAGGFGIAAQSGSEGVGLRRGVWGISSNMPHGFECIFLSTLFLVFSPWYPITQTYFLRASRVQHYHFYFCLLPRINPQVFFFCLISPEFVIIIRRYKL